MGTPFDFFGKQAHYSYSFKNSDINKNRLLLRSLMEKYGLNGIRTEWWHFSMKSINYPVESWEWPCE
jgi:D-alanyl-D-alanine dipeptidase